MGGDQGAPRTMAYVHMYDIKLSLIRTWFIIELFEARLSSGL